MMESENTVLERTIAKPQPPAPSADPEPLRRYTKAKLALASQLHALRQIIEQRGDKTRLQQCDDLMAKLAEDRFTLAVLGQFKRGKSSLMNAIIGRELLPVGVLPLTSAITILRYGPEERLLIRREHMDLPAPEEFPVRTLADFVTEKGNPGNRRQVKTATLEIPLTFLRRGLEFVDTPGVGSAIEANTATTMKFLPECDAALFVTSVDSPLNRCELDFLRGIRQHVHKIFFVVNKTDLLGSSERQEILDFVRDTIAREVGADEAGIFPVSSKLGLAAKQNDDWHDTLQSGLPELEGALARFLSNEKSAAFLDSILRRALWLLEQAAVEPGLHARARELPEAELLQRMDALTVRWEDCKHKRQQAFEKLRARVLAETEMALMPELASFLRTEAEAFIREQQRRLVPHKWWPIGMAWDETQVPALEQSRERIETWLSGKLETLSFARDESAISLWQQIQASLAQLPQIAAEAFGMRPPAGIATASPAPWRLPLAFETAFAFNASCQLPLPPWLAWVPSGLAWKWLSTRRQKETARLADRWRAAIVAYVIEQIRKSADKLAEKVEGRAEELGLRLMTSLTGTGDNADWNATAQALNATRRDLLALRKQVVPENTPSLTGDNFPLLVESPDSAPPRRITSHAAQPPKADPARDLKTRSCAACEHRSSVLFHFLAQLQYQLAQDEQAREAFAVTLGFCPLHTWQLESVMSHAGASAGFARFAEHVSQTLAARAKSPDGGRGPARFILKAHECHACRLLAETDREYLWQLTEFIQHPDGRSAYAASQGICLRHLELWLPLLPDAETARFILEVSARRFEEMSEDMRHFCLKTEALRRQWRNRDEEDAYHRAVIHLVGTPGNCQPMRGDAEI